MLGSPVEEKRNKQLLPQKRALNRIDSEASHVESFEHPPCTRKRSKSDQRELDTPRAKAWFFASGLTTKWPRLNRPAPFLCRHRLSRSIHMFCVVAHLTAKCPASVASVARASCFHLFNRFSGPSFHPYETPRSWKPDSDLGLPKYRLVGHRGTIHVFSTFRC